MIADCRLIGKIQKASIVIKGDVQAAKGIALSAWRIVKRKWGKQDWGVFAGDERPCLFHNGGTHWDC